jgi:short subunit dehydrogenase-like uncharacterized protein
MSNRVTLLGATSPLGQSVATYLAERIKLAQDSSLRPEHVVIAGSNTKRLNQIVQMIADKSGVKFSAMVVDAKDEDSLEVMVKSSKVVMATTNKYGAIVVDFCVKNGVHYCDLVGDSAWIAGLIRDYNELAMRNNVLVVGACGMLAMPSDLGSLFLIDYVRKKYEVGVKKIVGSVSLNSVSVISTIKGMSKVMESAESVGYLHPYILNPLDDKEYPPNGKIHSLDCSSVFPSFDSSQKRYNSTSVLCMASQNVVSRSGRLYNQAGFKYGKDFHYREFLSTGNFFSAIFQILIYLIFKLSLIFNPLFQLLKKLFWVLSILFPSSKIERDWFKIHLTAEIEGKSSKSVRAIVAGGDIMLKESAKMLAEAGIILAFQDKQLKVKGGVITPAFAFGNILIERLYKAGIKFEIIED